MNFGPALCALFVAVWALVATAANETLGGMLVVNGVVQVVLFTVVAIVPLIRTGRMSFVDIAWPFGVALIGAQIVLMGDGDTVRKVSIGGVYLLIGLRMGLGALTMAKTTGVIFQTEFPRYVYRRMELSGRTEGRIRFHTGCEIFAQGLANASVLAIPGFVMAVNAQGAVYPLEVAGIGLWLTAYVLESTADLQKLKFLSNNQGGVCDVGLWRYSRHPNYFVAWLVWTGMVLASAPSWLRLRGEEAGQVWAALGLGGLGASAMMYITLVHLTGAIPAEYYSVRKRPEYARYQQTTNMFFPWFPRS